MTLSTDVVKKLEALARKIAKLTDNNDHNESVLVLAKFIEDKESVEKMKAIQEKHSANGSMEWEWMKERDVIRNTLLQKVHMKYGTEIRNLLYGNF